MDLAILVDKSIIFFLFTIEGHLGKDGKFYVLDFARTMPPEAPDPKRFKLE